MVKVRSGQKLVAADLQYTVSIKPGSGTQIFIGPQEEAKKLRQWVTPAD